MKSSCFNLIGTGAALSAALWSAVLWSAALIIVGDGSGATAAPARSPATQAKAQATAPKVQDKAPLKATATPPASTVTINFPSRTMGKIFISNGNWDPMTLPPGGKFYAAARGPITLRSDQIYTFEPNMLVCEQPELLLQFPRGTLHYLNLNKLEVNDKLLDVVGQLPSVRAIQMAETDITDAQLKKLSNIGTLEHLNLSGNMLKGSGFREMKGCNELVKLDICFNALERKFGDDVAHFPKLRALFACHAGVKDVDVESIAKIKTLEHVKLSSNFDVTDKGVKALAALPKLGNIEIDGTKSNPASLLALKGLNLHLIGLDQEWDNRTIRMMLKKAFPKASFNFKTNNGERIPVEVFEPLH